MAIETLYPAIRPSLDLNFAGSKALDPRITFARASAATYYDGKTVAKAEENLFLYSQDLSSGYWQKNATTVVSNSVVAPDGTMTGNAFTADGTLAAHNALQFFQVQPAHTVSFYAKAGTASVVQVFRSGNASIFANFDLSNGVVGTFHASVSVSMVSVGEGWYRCSVYTALTTAGYVYFGIVSSPSSARNESNSSNGTVYLWGAQLEQRDQVTAYTPTTTQPITNYIPVLQTAPAGVPRFDHNPVTGESLGLLVEEQRTNVRTWSQQFDNAAWSKNNLTVAANTIIAPDGTLTGDKLIENAVNSSHTVSGTISAAGTCTLSFYLKAAERTRVSLTIYDVGAGTSYGTSFDLYSGVVGTNSAGSTATITPVGNGWFRCSVSRAILGSGGPFTIFVSNAAGGNSYQGDGYSGIYIWGAQLEAGAFPTSYIKTEASQATRVADSAQMTGANFSSWYRQDEGTLFAEASLYARRNSGFETIIQMSSGVNNNAISLGTQAPDSYARGISNLYGSIACDIGVGTIQKDKQFKAAFSYATNNFAVSSSNVNPTTDTSGGVPTGLNSAFFGRETVFDSPFAGHIRRIAYYPKRLSDAQLQALTA